MNNNTQATSCNHRYNPARFKAGDTFNSDRPLEQVLTPVTPEERSAANDRRESVAEQARKELFGKG